MVERMFATDGVSKFHGTLPSILVVPTKPLLPSGDDAAAFHAVKDPSKTDRAAVLPGGGRVVITMANGSWIRLAYHPVR